MSAKLSVEKYALTTQTYGVPLICTMKKYTRPGISKDPNAPGVILLLGHGAGFFKETWEPTIEDLYEMDDKRPSGSIIREIWGLDCQNHGEACTVNEDTLSRNLGLLTIWDYADAFATLYKSGLLGTLNPKLHEVVLCGHSAGAVGVALSTSYFNPPSRVPFSKIILVDPPIWGKEKDGQDSDVYKMVSEMTPVRKDTWKSFEDASKWLKKRLPWGSWDDRVFDAYTKHGLRDLPTAFYPDKSGTTLTTHRLAENVAFTGKRFAYDALDRLNQICAFVPVHLIYGDNNDMFDREVQDSLINEREGRVFASVSRLEDVGHLVPQQAPTQLAGAILSVLVRPSAIKAVSSKL
ncbi:alpha/beta-hydrolase [Pholiota conissans]|uniref:Alpha/beta-hydrolase n=1 Tax=Pholiota conissans TaxID=109636 RepID=A0A9P6CSP9_9AGAR|nr:alpha/beta-hydrolase [Pholiota conissans]